MVMVCAVAAGSFAYLNHVVGSIPRIPVKFLVQDNPSAGTTILLTDAQVGPTGISAAQAVNPLKMNRVLHALVSMLTVDSSFNNSQVESLATDLGGLTGSAGTYVTAPTRATDGSVVFKPAQSSDLWSAIKSGSIAAFAKKYPKTVTPAAP